MLIQSICPRCEDAVSINAPRVGSRPQCRCSERTFPPSEPHIHQMGSHSTVSCHIRQYCTQCNRSAVAIKYCFNHDTSARRPRQIPSYWGPSAVDSRRLTLLDLRFFLFLLLGLCYLLLMLTLEIRFFFFRLRNSFEEPLQPGLLCSLDVLL